jgi:hypothetical protein
MGMAGLRMPSDRDLGYPFCSQKCSAKERGIEWLLSFEEWYKIWVDSGKFPLRGRKKGQYCMARFGDVGPYSVDNVKIILIEENISEGHVEHIAEEHKQAIRIANTGRILTEIQRAKIGPTKRGKKLTFEHRKKCSNSLRGRVLTEEHKKSMRGPRGPNPKMKWSDERKTKFSEARKVDWINGTYDFHKEKKK